MTEALLHTFQSQLSAVMETVLKSAMFEITRLVEGSFLEEVGHHKQEVEVLKLRLQLSESKLREKERERELERERDRERGRRARCPDCGRAGDSSRGDCQATEAPRGMETLCLGLNLRDHPTVHPPEPEVMLNTRQHLEPTKQNASTLSKDKSSSHRHSTKELVTINSPAQVPADFLQRLLTNSTAHSSSEFKRNQTENDFILEKKIDSTSKQSLSISSEEVQKDLLSSSPDERVKSESELGLQRVKEEEEMVPVWESINRDDGFHGDMADLPQPELRGSCDQEEIQVESFPGLNSLDMADATSYFTPYSVNTLLHQGLRAQHSHLSTTELMLSSVPEGTQSFIQAENGQSYPGSESVTSASEKRVSHPKSSKRFSHVHAERSNQCMECGKKFLRASDLKAHLLVHKGKKPLSCLHCNEKFAYNFELKVHLRNHSGDRPHVCQYCGKAFSRMSNFRQHQNIHTREKLFSCFQCGMRFNRATNLRVHLRRHSHAVMAYNCPHCTKTFLNLRQKKSHLLKAHGGGGGGGGR